MTTDPRNHISVGIDGRQYSRPAPVYIDVLGLPTITEAVEAASEMLRRGIIRAMSTNPSDKSNPASKAEKLDRQKTQSPANPRAQTPAHTGNTSARRDPVSVYSAVTKRFRKTNPESDPSSHTNADYSAADPLKDKLQTDSQIPSPNAWSSAKRAGPSILSKRNRPPAGGTSAGERVFQPSSKRERRPEAAQDASKRHMTKAASIAISSSMAPQTQAASSTRPLQPFVRNGPSKANASKLSEAVTKQPKTKSSANVTTDTLPPVPSKKITASSSASKKPQALLLPKGILKKPKPVISKPPAKSILKSPNVVSKPASQPQSLGTVRSPGAAKLPSAWSQVTGKSSKTNSTGTQGNSLLRQPGKGFLFPKTNFSLGSSNSRATASNPTSAPQEVAAKKATPQLSVRPAVAVTASEAVIPLPSSSGLQVKHVPGSEIIRGVRPNGYTVSREGVVKPVVTFSPKPKLPHKLRQTSVEKLFEGYRDIKKLAEGDALARALREEQEMYADAKGRVEYRAAVTVRLKDVRK